MNELAGIFDRWCRDRPDRDAYVVTMGRSAQRLSRGDLGASARELARELRDEAGEEIVAVEAETSPHTLVAIWACVLADARFTVIPAASGAGSTAAGRADVASRLIGRHVRILTAKGNVLSPRPAPNRLAAPRIPGVLQLTSGTTGEPSMCHLPYAAVVRNLDWCTEAFASAAGGTASSWVPLYHDMGLFGGVMWAARSDVRTVLMSPLEYVRHPMRWLDQIDQYKVAATLCPSFVLNQFNRLLARGAFVGADLRTLRHLIVGAEPISASEARQFLAGLEPFRLSPDSFHACFGLAEMTLLATSNPGGLRTRRLSASPQSDPIEVVSLGRPVGTTRCELDGESAGRLSLTSTSQTIWTTKLGFIDELATIPTGDLAAMVDHDLFVFGRWDDTLTVHGQQVPATALETAARRVAGVIDAAVVRIDGVDGAICAMVEVEPDTQLSDAAVREAIVQATGVMVTNIELVGRGAIPRTSSGKVRRAGVRTRLEHSDLRMSDPGGGNLSG